MTLRILHCIYDDLDNPWVAGGGAVRVFQLYRRLAGRVAATVATGAYPGAQNQTRDGVRYLHLGSPQPYAWSRLTYAREANRLLRRSEYDAAIFDFSSYTPVFVPPDRPVGITVHHLSGPTARARWGLAAPLVGGLERAMIRRTRWLSATSSATMEALREIAAPGATIDLIHAGVPDELFALEREEADFLLYFGRLDVFHKGLDTLLLSMARLVRERPELELRIAGRGKDAPRITELITQLDLKRNVRLLGGVSDEERLRLLASAKVMMMPSRFEGFGMVAAEAMAAGVPLIATAVDSLPEVVAPPQGGILVPPNDPDAFAAAVVKMLDAPELRRDLSSSARRSAERFRWDAIAEQHLEFLQKIARRSVHGLRTDDDENDHRTS